MCQISINNAITLLKIIKDEYYEPGVVITGDEKYVILMYVVNKVMEYPIQLEDKIDTLKFELLDDKIDILDLENDTIRQSHIKLPILMDTTETYPDLRAFVVNNCEESDTIINDI